MATVESNFKELMRRGFLWNKNITLDDGYTSLLYDDNPNNAKSDGTPGERKLYSLLPSATFYQSSGVWWLKTNLPNTWSKISFGDNVLEANEINIIEITNIKTKFKEFIGFTENIFLNNKISEINKYKTSSKEELEFKKEMIYVDNILVQTNLYYYEKNQLLKTYFFYENDVLKNISDELIFGDGTIKLILLDTITYLTLLPNDYENSIGIKYDNGATLSTSNDLYIYTPFLEYDDDKLEIKIRKVNIFENSENMQTILTFDETFIRRDYSITTNPKILIIKSTSNYVFFTLQIPAFFRSVIVYCYNKTKNILFYYETSITKSTKTNLVLNYENENELLFIGSEYYSDPENQNEQYAFLTKLKIIDNSFNYIIGKNIGLFFSTEYFNSTLYNFSFETAHWISDYNVLYVSVNTTNANDGSFNTKLIGLNLNTDFDEDFGFGTKLFEGSLNSGMETYKHNSIQLNKNDIYFQNDLIDDKIFEVFPTTSNDNYIYAINSDYSNTKHIFLGIFEEYVFFEYCNVNADDTYIQMYKFEYDGNSTTLTFYKNLASTSNGVAIQNENLFSGISLFYKTKENENEPTLYAYVYRNTHTTIFLIDIDNDILEKTFSKDINIENKTIVFYKRFFCNKNMTHLPTYDSFNFNLLNSNKTNYDDSTPLTIGSNIFPLNIKQVSNVIEFAKLSHFGNEYIDDFIKYKISVDNINWFSYNELTNNFEKNIEPNNINILNLHIKDFQEAIINKKISFKAFFYSNDDGTQIPVLQKVSFMYKREL